MQKGWLWRAREKKTNKPAKTKENCFSRHSHSSWLCSEGVWISCLHWMRSSIDCGPNVNDVKEASTEIFTAPSIFSFIFILLTHEGRSTSGFFRFTRFSRNGPCVSRFFVTRMKDPFGILWIQRISFGAVVGNVSTFRRIACHLIITCVWVWFQFKISLQMWFRR